MTGHLPPTSTDQYVVLPQAPLVATRALLTVRQNITDTTDARAMTCVHGGADYGKTVAVTSRQLKLEPDEDIRRITFHTRLTTRPVRHELSTALELPGQPACYASEFDDPLKNARAGRSADSARPTDPSLSAACAQGWTE